MNAIDPSSADHLITEPPAAPPALVAAAVEIEAALAPRVRRAAAAMHQTYVANPVHLELVGWPRRRRWAASWKVLSNCSVLVAVDLTAGGNGAEVEARVNGHIVATGVDDARPLVHGIARTFDAVGLPA